MKVISFVSCKGGTGKSTVSISTALILQQQGHKVLFLDLDPQNSSTFFFLNEESEKSIFQVLMGAPAHHNIESTSHGIDILPSDLRLLDCRTIEFTKLKQSLNSIKDKYDYCIIDSAPTYDNLTISCYMVANIIIIPTTVDVFSCKTVHFLFDKFELLEINKTIGIVLNMFKPSKSENPNTWANREADLFLKDEKLKDFLVNTTVPRSTTLHRLIAEPGYSIKGKASNNLHDFVSEITGQQLTINNIGGSLL